MAYVSLLPCEGEGLLLPREGEGLLPRDREGLPFLFSTTKLFGLHF